MPIVTTPPPTVMAVIPGIIIAYMPAPRGMIPGIIPIIGIIPGIIAGVIPGRMPYRHAPTIAASTIITLPISITGSIAVPTRHLTSDGKIVTQRVGIYTYFIIKVDDIIAS